MGNCIGSIHWQEQRNDLEIYKIFMVMRERHGLSLPDRNRLFYEPTMKNRYGVEISGLWIYFYGRKNTNEKIKNFLIEASEILRKRKIKFIINQEYL